MKTFLVITVDLQDPEYSRVFGTVEAENEDAARQRVADEIGITVEELESSDDVTTIFTPFEKIRKIGGDR